MMNIKNECNINQRHMDKKEGNYETEKFETDIRIGSSHSVNAEKDLIDIFEKCIEIRDVHSNEKKENELLYTSEHKYEKAKRKMIDSSKIEINQFDMFAENNGITLNSSKSNNYNSLQLNQNDTKMIETHNKIDDERKKLTSSICYPQSEKIPDNSDIQLCYTNGLNIHNIEIEYKEYESEIQMNDIMQLIQAELSEPYSIYTYRYFIYNWPKLCFLATHGKKYVGAIVCKLDMHMNVVKRGYIAMLAVKKEYRKLKIGTNLVQKAIDAMLADNADEVVLETEMKNVSALRLYENLGFVRDKRLFRYYLNGVDALRLKLWFN